MQNTLHVTWQRNNFQKVIASVNLVLFGHHFVIISYHLLSLVLFTWHHSERFCWKRIGEVKKGEFSLTVGGQAILKYC